MSIVPARSKAHFYRGVHIAFSGESEKSVAEQPLSFRPEPKAQWRNLLSPAGIWGRIHIFGSVPGVFHFASGVVIALFYFFVTLVVDDLVKRRA